MSTADERRAALRQRREDRTANNIPSVNANKSSSASNQQQEPRGSSAASTGYGANRAARFNAVNQNLGDKPLQEAVYSTSLRVLGHSSSSGQVIFTTSHLPQLGLTSIKPIAQLGNQLQRIILDSNALESLEDLSFCVSLVHLSVAGNRLEHSNIFKHLVRSAGSLNYLNVSDNKISSLAGVEKLRFLVTLLVDKNRLTSLEVDTSEDALRSSANENCGAHTAKLLDDIIFAIDEANQQAKSKSSRRNSITSGSDFSVLTSNFGSRNQSSMRFQSAAANEGSGALFRSSRTNALGAGGGVGKSVSFGDDKDASCSGSQSDQTSPLRFLVSLWRFSAAENELKSISPRVFERCPLRLLNLSNNALTALDFVLPLHKSLMVLIADGNEISHLPASTTSGGLRRAGSRHLSDAPHPSKVATHPDVAHLNFQMMTRLVSLNLGQNNIASFQEIAELKNLPQLRHLTLSNCTLCSLPTNRDLDLREAGTVKVKLDTVRKDNVAADAMLLAGGTTSGGNTGLSAALSLDDQLAETIEGGDASADTLALTGNRESVIGRKKSSVIITSPSMEFNPANSHASLNNTYSNSNTLAGSTGSNSQSFAIEALIRPDDSEQVTLRTPEEQDHAEFNKRTAEERYRLQILQSVPQLQTLDGIPCTTEDIAEAQQLAGGHLREERTRAITKYIKPTSGAAGAALRKLVHRQHEDDE